MKKLLVISFMIFPYFLKAQVTATHPDSLAYHRKAEDSIARHDRLDTAFFKNLPQRPDTWVTDYTNTLSSEQNTRLESKLDSFNKEGTGQLTVVIMKTIGDYEIMIYGRRLGNYWSVGHEGKDDGVLVLIALDDRKMAILTGIGIEKVLTDKTCHNIIQTDFIPNFKLGDYYQGVDTGISDIMNYISASK